MKSSVSLITLGSKDLKKSAEFYEKSLRLPKLRVDGDVTFFDLQGTWLSLYPWDLLAKGTKISKRDPEFKGITFAHNVKTKQEVLETLKRAEKAGATIIKEGEEVEDGFSGYFRDLDDHLWEVCYNPLFWTNFKKTMQKNEI
jgi:catechol 2,3-dioxygenase-like lactoylglutathione lyase family enzyme